MSKSTRRRTTPAGPRRKQDGPRPNVMLRQFAPTTPMAHALTVELTAEEIREHTYPLLTPADHVLAEDHPGCTYVRRVGADFFEFLVHQNGEFLRRLTDEDVAKVGASELYVLARQRLRQVPSDWCEVVRRDGGEFHILRGVSEFVASKLLLLPEVLEPLLGPAMLEPFGVLVSVPSRQELVVAPVGANIAASLVHQARYTLMTHDESTNPVSPATYWWHEGELTPVVTVDETGFVDFRMLPAFTDAAALAADDVA